MATVRRYGKPSMTNLPKEIFEEIVNTPRMDYQKLKKDADRLEQQMMEEMKKHGDDVRK